MESPPCSATGTSGTASELHAASVPIIPAKVSEVEIKQQISAPSYLLSLSENPAPPFMRPGKKPRPRILTGTVMCEREAVEMVAAAGKHGLRKFISNFVVEKKITENFSIRERKFLTSLVCELVDYAAQRDFSAFKLAVLVTLYLDSHTFFKWYYYLSAGELWDYFMETVIRHTIQDSPEGEEVFDPEESYDILTHFHAMYLSNLPLVHLTTFGATRLKLTWPFKLK